MGKLVVLSTTFSSREDAERMASLLLERRLIACAHIAGPITSVYRWQGKVCNTPEYTLSVKTTSRHWQTLHDVIRQEHPYELPEIVGQELAYASDAYCDWVSGEVQ